MPCAQLSVFSQLLIFILWSCAVPGTLAETQELDKATAVWCECISVRLLHMKPFDPFKTFICFEWDNKVIALLKQ